MLRVVYSKLEQASDLKWFYDKDTIDYSIVEKFADSFKKSVKVLESNANYLFTNIDKI